MTIHKTAIIDASAKIGEKVIIDPYVVVGPGSVIGDGSHLMSHSIVSYTELGKACIVYPHASLGLEPQHLGYKNEPTKLVVGDRSVFRECVTAHRGSMFDQGVTVIGSDCFFMAYSHIAHDCVIGDHVIMANGAQLAGHVHVGNRAFISTTVGIHQFVRLGEGVIISGGAMVPLDVAPYCMAQGDRASIKGLNLVGMKRAGLSRQSIKAVKDAFKTIFLSGLKLDEALLKDELNVDDPHVAIFKKFFMEPKRGFLRPDQKETNQKEEAL